MRELRLLFIGGGPLMPLSQPMTMLKFEYLSKYFSGDIIQPVMDTKHTLIKSIGSFCYHPFVVKGNFLIKNIKLFSIYIKTAMELYRKNGKYDVIIAPNPLLSGFISLIIGLMVGTRVIIEVNGNFESSFRFGSRRSIKPSLIESLKEIYSRITIPFVLKRADMVKLVSDNQLKVFKINFGSIQKSIFPNFVPIKKFIESQKRDEKYILLLGYPWYLKGVDVLIKAFNMITTEFPKYRLKVVGWCPEGKKYYQSLSGNNARIELCDPVYYEEVIPLMTECSLYVLASRTDASPRVLREAMACRKPIIASNTDGVPDLIKDGYNGLLFEKENVGDLAAKLKLLLGNKELAATLAGNGFHYVQEHLSEKCYINNYRKMINECLSI